MGPQNGEGGDEWIGRGGCHRRGRRPSQKYADRQLYQHSPLRSGISCYIVWSGSLGVKFYNEVNFDMRWILVAFVCLGLPLLGQTLGDISGRIDDPSGAAVPGAAVTLTNTATNAVRNAESSGDGLYTFPSVPPGVYNLKAEHPGFRTVTSNNVQLTVQQSVRLDLTLQVGQVSETVEVSATAALLQAENATVGTVIENREIAEAPLNGREYLNLVTLAPNVSNFAPAAGQA